MPLSRRACLELSMMTETYAIPEFLRKREPVVRAPIERPAPFKAPMVRAMLRDKNPKTQTRRIMKPQPHPAFLARGVHGVVPQWPNQDGVRWFMQDGMSELVKCPYGRPASLTLRPIQSTGGVYSAGDDGRIYRDGKSLQPWRGGYGQQYEMVSAGDQRKAYVHRLVCEAFYGTPPQEMPEVRHLDGDSLNNRPENLDWGTKEQNAADRSAHGKVSGEAHHASKLSAANVAEIRTLRGSMTRPAPAARFGVSKGTIDDVLDGRGWITRTAPPPNLPRYERQPGDRLWVRETWGACDYFDNTAPRDLPHFAAIKYFADGSIVGATAGYGLIHKARPSIHMPRQFSRILLEIVDVRVERLQDISESDALAEGISCENVIVSCHCHGGHHVEESADRYFFDGCQDEGFRSAADAYAGLWESINGPGSWAANPWVWCLTFKRVTP